MRRFLSWVVLLLLCILTSFLEYTAYGLGNRILDFMKSAGPVLKLISFLFSGAIFLVIISLPIYWGAVLSASIPEAIKPSKNGLRYIILSGSMLILSVIHIIMELTKGAFRLDRIMMCIYYLLLIKCY